MLFTVELTVEPLSVLLYINRVISMQKVFTFFG